MRIPLTKIYRAFSELDDLSDEQCERLMRRVRLRIGTNLGVGLVLCAFYAGAFIVTIILASLIGSVIDLDDQIARKHEALATLIALVLMFGIPAAVTLAVRDLIYRRRLTQAIDYEIDRVRCLSCKYILIGQVARDDHLTCPECGTRQHLAELGITEADLIPPSV